MGECIQVRKNMGGRVYVTFGLGASLAGQELRPVIKVVGVGGAGCNIVGSADIDFRHAERIAINTDARSLYGLSCRKILIGKELTRGRGASSDPAIGEQAVLSDIDAVRSALAGTDVLFLVCGLGGGTGTGASPVIARLAGKMGALVVALATMPFKAEGALRGRIASAGLERLRETADAVLVVENDRLVTEHPMLGFKEALCMADHLLLDPVRSITQVLTRADLPNLRRVLRVRDIAHICLGEGSLGHGPSSGVKFALGPLAPVTDLHNHNKAVVVLHCPPGSKDDELHRIVQELHTFLHEDAEIMWGPIVDPSLEKEVRLVAVVGKERAPGPPIPHP